MSTQTTLIFSPDFPTLGTIARTGSQVSYRHDGEIDLGDCASVLDVRASLCDAIDHGCEPGDGARVAWDGAEDLLTIAEIMEG